MLFDEFSLLALRCAFQRCSCLPDSFLNLNKQFAIHPELQIAEPDTLIPKYIPAQNTKAIETFYTYIISSAYTAMDFCSPPVR